MLEIDISFAPTIHAFSGLTSKGKEEAPPWVADMLNSVGYRTYDLGLGFDWSYSGNMATLFIIKEVESTVTKDDTIVRFANVVDLHPQFRLEPREKLRRAISKVFALALLHELDEQLVIGEQLTCDAHARGRIEEVSRVAEKYAEGLTTATIPYRLSSLNDEAISKLTDAWRGR